MSTDAVLSQIEQILQGIETRTPHTDKCCESVTDGAIKCDSCYCDRADRLRTEIARAIQRIGNAAMEAYQSASFANQMAWMDDEDAPQQDTDAAGWAAGVRAGGTEPQ